MKATGIQLEMERVLTYIWHDCFVYQGENCVIVFDYWKNPPHRSNPDCEDFTHFLQQISHRDKSVPLPVYFLVSHHHKDHFNKKIFALSSILPGVRYIISKDTERSVRYLLKPGSTYSGPLKTDPERVTTLRPGDSFTDEIVSVHAFGSTDIGNSYVIEVDGLRLFHAGDLNAWIWKDESTQAEVDAAIRSFETILADIYKEFQSFDCAMFPVDARIGRDWWEGAARFVRTFAVRLFVPMHFCLFETSAQKKEFERKATAFGCYSAPATVASHSYYCSLTTPWQSLSL